MSGKLGKAAAGPARVEIHRAEILGNRAVAADLFQMQLALPRDWGPPQPGQYVSLTLEEEWNDRMPGDAGRGLLRRPFCIAGHKVRAGRTVIDLLYARVGKITAALGEKQPGDGVDLLGPAGTAFPLPAAAPCVLVGGGRGIAPFLYVAQVLEERDLPLTILYGVRSAAQAAPLVGPLEHARLATEDGSAGVRGTALDLLEQLNPAPPAVVLACGPVGLLAAVVRWSQEHGTDCWVSLEEVFGCSLGLCGGCAVPARGDGPYERFLWACRDGPVVPAGRINWEAWLGQ